MNHNHGPVFGNHICMWEGPSHNPSALEVNHEALKAQAAKNIEEIQRLRAILDANSISWAKSTPKGPAALRQSRIIPWTRSQAAKQKTDTNTLPLLPNEIQLHILKLAVTNKHPIIDPFWKLRPENITVPELQNASINLRMLLTCKAFRIEGLKYFMANNSFIFTQVEAVQNFASISQESRSTIAHVTFRIVGKYYDDSAYKKTIRGDATYHQELDYPTVWVEKRPAGSPKDQGIQAYCWNQVMDFFKAMLIHPAPRGRRQQLFPGIKTMRLDLVNFCEHLPFVGSPMISVFRWHVGKVLDELIITGALDEEISNGEERYLTGIIKDNGVIGSGCPVFRSAKNCLKPLPGYGLNLQVVRPKHQSSVPFKLGKSTPGGRVSHPDGGLSPVSQYPDGWTIWKWTTDSLSNPKKRWIEFHRKCGLPVDDCGELQALAELESDESSNDEGAWEDAADNAEDLDSDLDSELN